MLDKLFHLRVLALLSLVLLAPVPDGLTQDATASLVIMTDDGPPHMIRESDSGIDIDITRSILASIGVTAEIRYASLARAKMSVENGMADIVVPTFYQEDTDSFFLSAPIIRYRPTVFTRTSDGHSFDQLSDIRNLRIATFQGAREYFGEVFVEMTADNIYMELHDMSRLPELLAARRADVVVLDYYIFRYFAQQLEPGSRTLRFKVHELFPPVPAYAGFHSRALRDRFNEALAGNFTDADLAAIVARYIKPEIDQGN